MQDDASAEKSYRKAVRLDPHLVNSRLGLAKIYQRQQKYPAALAEADAAVEVDPARPDAHYVRGQALLRLGRKEEAKKELDAAARASSDGGKEPEAGPVPSPELLQDSR
jgi:eukaryotic-like serine/threonine-protein kinase